MQKRTLLAAFLGAALAVPACSLLFSPQSSNVGSGDGGDSIDASAFDSGLGTTPAVHTPQIFPKAAARMRLVPPYLFEGQGFRFRDWELREAAAPEPIPLVIDGLLPSDSVSLAVSEEPTVAWIFCGQAIEPGASAKLADLLSAGQGCVRKDGMVGLSVVLPVDSAFGSTETSSRATLSVTVSRGEQIIPLEVQVAGLKEVFEMPLPTDADLYSKIKVDWTFSGDESAFPANTKALRLISMTDLSVKERISVSGQAGLRGSIGPCTALTCRGGASGIGGSAGASSNCATPPCNGEGNGKGIGGDACTAVAQDQRANGGSGAGHHGSGTSGQAGLNCGLNTPDGGSAYAETIDEVASTAGSGGGGGGNILSSGATAALAGGGGGGGGGALALKARGRVFFAPAGGPIEARGGDGGGGLAASMGSFIGRAGHGGGGSGGTVTITAQEIILDSGTPNPIDVSGGLGSLPSAAPAGNGAPGVIRVDARGQSLTFADFRGADFDVIDPVTSAIEWNIRGNDFIKAATVQWAYRRSGEDAYTLERDESTASANTFRPQGWKPGLYELCVLANVFTSDAKPVADVKPEAKRCTWVALMPPQ